MRESAIPAPKVEKNQQMENLIALNKKIMGENVDMTKRVIINYFTMKKIRDLEDELELMKNLS